MKLQVYMYGEPDICFARLEPGASRVNRTLPSWQNSCAASMNQRPTSLPPIIQGAAYITVDCVTTALQNGACTHRCISEQMHYKTPFSPFMVQALQDPPLYSSTLFRPLFLETLLKACSVLDVHV